MNENGSPNFNQFQRDPGAPIHLGGEGSQQGFNNPENSMPETRPMIDHQQSMVSNHTHPPQPAHIPTSEQNHVQEQVPRVDHLPRVDHGPRMDQMIKVEHGRSDPVARVDQEIKSEPLSPLPSDPAMQAILAYFRKHNLTETENKLKDELKKREVAAPIVPQVSDPEVGNVLAAYRSDGDPSSYESAYR